MRLNFNLYQMNKLLPIRNETLRRTWMVIYTRSKWEKKVDQVLKKNGIESYCPLVKTNRRWADRNMVVEIPLFNSYLFVRVNQIEQTKVRETLGVVNFIYYCGKPAMVNDYEIEQIRNAVDNYKDVETLSIRDLNTGDRIKITNGALADCVGEVMEVQGKSVLVSIKQLDCVLVAKVVVNRNIKFATPSPLSALAGQA